MKLWKKFSKRVASVLSAALLITGATMALPAFAAETEGSLTIHKHSGQPIDDIVPDGSPIASIPNPPLPGVEFTVSQITTSTGNSEIDKNVLAELTKFLYNNPNNPDRLFPTDSFFNSENAPTVPNALKDLVLVDSVVKVTDDNGEAEWGSLPLGSYYIVESKVPNAVVESSLPFLVSIPMVNSKGNLNYDVHAYPKNETVAIRELAVDAGHWGLDNIVHWKVFSTIPNIDVNSFRLYTTLDTRLANPTAVVNMEIVAPAKNVKSRAGDVVFNDSDYVAVVNDNTIEINFTNSGLEKINQSKGSEVVWTFGTDVIAVGNGIIPNRSQLLVNKPNGVWNTDSVISNEVTTNWGVLNIDKQDKNKKALAGAQFKLFGSESDANDCVKLAIENKSENCKNVIIVNDQDVFVSNDDGKVVVPGVHVGINESLVRDYWVVETVAPKGYNLLKSPEMVKVNVGDNSTIVIVNTLAGSEVVPPVAPPIDGGNGVVNPGNNSGTVSQGINSTGNATVIPGILALIALGVGSIIMRSVQRKKFKNN